MSKKTQAKKHVEPVRMEPAIEPPRDSADMVDCLRREIATLQAGKSSPVQAKALSSLVTTIVRVQDHEMKVERFLDERASSKRLKPPSVSRYPRPVMIGSR